MNEFNFTGAFFFIEVYEVSAEMLNVDRRPTSIIKLMS